MGDSVNDATHTITTYAVLRLGVFLFGFQHSVPGISHNVSGYKTPIQNMNEFFASGIKLYYPSVYHYIFENGDEAGLLNMQRNLQILHDIGPVMSRHGTIRI